MPEMIFGGIPIIALLMGLLEVVKKIGVNPKYIPVISVVLGVTSGIVLFGQGDIKVGVIQGMYIGLSAVGLYSGAKNTMEK